MVCQQLFIIPSADGGEAQKVILDPRPEYPLPGFYEAVFIKSWRMFTDRADAAGLVFVLAAVCFRFFIGHAACLIGLVTQVTALGCLFWYYMEIIESTAFDEDVLPESYIGGLSGLIYKIIKSICIFLIVLIIIELPFFIIAELLKKAGLQWPVLQHGIVLVGLFLFPMAILTVAVGKDIIMIFEVTKFFKPIIRALAPYMTVAALAVTAAVIQYSTPGYGRLAKDEASLVVIGLCLAVNIIGVMIAIIAMRGIGLFYRHYSCFLEW